MTQNGTAIDKSIEFLGNFYGFPLSVIGSKKNIKSISKKTLQNTYKRFLAAPVELVVSEVALEQSRRLKLSRSTTPQRKLDYRASFTHRESFISKKTVLHQFFELNGCSLIDLETLEMYFNSLSSPVVSQLVIKQGLVYDLEFSRGLTGHDEVLCCSLVTDKDVSKVENCLLDNLKVETESWKRLLLSSQLSHQKACFDRTYENELEVVALDFGCKNKEEFLLKREESLQRLPDLVKCIKPLSTAVFKIN